MGGAVHGTMRLGTSVWLLPIAASLPLAKELATLQNLSKGRLILGAGVGWLEAEFDALGVPFKERGRRMDEGIAMMKAVWSQDPMTFGTKWISRRSATCGRSRKPIRADPDLDWWIVRRRDSIALWAWMVAR